MYYFYVYPFQNDQLQPFNYHPAFYGIPPQNQIQQSLPTSLNGYLERQEQRPLQQFQPIQVKSVENGKIPQPKIQGRQRAPQPTYDEKLPFVDKHNIVPNNINHIMAFLQRKSKSEKVVERIIMKLQGSQGNFTAKGFFSYQMFVKNKMSTHVNLKALEMAITHLDIASSIFSPEEQMFYNRVSMIAIRYYLKVIAPLVSLNSQRLKNTSKFDHLRAQRFLSILLIKNHRNQSSFQAFENEEE